MRVLHLVHSLEAATGGTARAVEWLAGACAGAGWETTLATAHVDAGGGHAGGAEIEVFPPRERLDARTGSEALREWYRSNAERFDVVVSHGLWQFPTALQRLRRPARSVVVPHGMLDPWFRHAYPLKHLVKQLWWWRGEGAVVNGADAVVFTAEDEAARARGVFLPFRPSVSICPLGIADPGTSGEDPGPLAGIGLHPGARFILFLARLHPKKGADLAVEAWRSLGPATLGWNLVVAGPAEDAVHAARVREAAEACNSAGHAGRILMPGMASGALKWALLRHARALILPSHQDNFGIAVAEALAVGTPVLLSNAVNIWREVVADGAGAAESPDLGGVRSLISGALSASDEAAGGARSAARRCFEGRFSSGRAAGLWLNALAGRGAP